ncbi:MAG: hypothetical protein J6T45_04840 [Fibrobacterales bacterium]|nr:hypothetical protein [Fibrobacterales bacterium]
MMRKSFLFVLFFAAANSFAVYFDIGLGFGGTSTSVGGKSFGDACEGCSELSVDLGLRVGGQINEQFWIAGEFGGVGNRYYDSENYVQFNTYMLGPSFIYYPAEHGQLFGTVGYAWTGNMTDLRDEYGYTATVYNGSGFALALGGGYNFGTENGALLGAKLFFSSVTLEESHKDEANVGLLVFVRFVHKSTGGGSGRPD